MLDLHTEDVRTNGQVFSDLYSNGLNLNFYELKFMELVERVRNENSGVIDSDVDLLEMVVKSGFLRCTSNIKARQKELLDNMIDGWNR